VTQLGFVIDQSRCIGCHACTVACKQENDVPLGVFRTWVKYVETGTFPDVNRHFAVMRCNQCTRAPCVTICPTEALHKRPDGIVDLDRDLCVGCRACMEACPYEALHFDEGRKVASKCHFCAHRVEQQLAPACAAVCPTKAILPVDFDDPDDPHVARARAGETTVRRPEMRTGPNVHYLAASPLALDPAAAHRPSSWIWSQRTPGREEVVGVGPAGARVVMEPVHTVPWGWHVTLFLLVKGTESGFAAMAPFTSLSPWLGPIVGAVGTTIVAALMIGDLGHPERFYLLLTHGNLKSWLTRAAWLLMGYGALHGVALAALALGLDGLARGCELAGILAAPVVAGYSGLLFRQCEGRELWRSRLAVPRMLTQAVAAGAALGVALGAPGLLPIALAGFVAYLGLALAYRRGDGQPAWFLRTARPAGLHPLVALVAGAACVAASAFVPPLALLGIALLFVEDSAWVRAGQLPANA
jgi:Fe-S-cluster-containing dehydrogenase component